MSLPVVGQSRHLKLAIFVAALGYFVDVFDLVLFSVVRVPSLKDLGLTPDQITDQGVLLINMQMIGMLIGGLIWGMAGDKFGRVKVLFGSILLYSLANIANAYVQDVNSYAALRFLAGLGLAGEVGAGITLVAELMPKEKRGLACAFVAAVGVGGGVAASLVVHLWDWRTAYIVGGCAGLVILMLRAGVHESGLFKELSAHAQRADLRLLFTRERAGRYLCCLLVGVPIWFFVGIILTFCPEIGKALGIAEVLTPSKAVLYGYVGFVIGDMGSGIVSQLLQSRRKAILIFLLGGLATVALVLSLPGQTAASFYILCVVGGTFMGYWALMLTTAAEQFGTNLRATVTTTVPNFVRGFTVVATLMFGALKGPLGVVPAVGVIAAFVFGLALLSLWKLRETFHQDLDFVEKAA